MSEMLVLSELGEAAVDAVYWPAFRASLRTQASIWRLQSLEEPDGKVRDLMIEIAKRDGYRAAVGAGFLTTPDFPWPPSLTPVKRDWLRL